MRFEKFEIWRKGYTLLDCVYLNRERIGNFLTKNHKGFRFSQVVDSMLYYYTLNPQADDNMHFEVIDPVPNKHGYIIPVAVQYHPDDWSDMTNGVKDASKISVFELINPTYLKDLQNGDAMLLLDQSVEGYNTVWLWDWFHKKCEQYKINPAAIIYLTGDQSCVDSYEAWCEHHPVTSKLKVIPSTSLSMYIKKHYDTRKLKSDFDELLTYKSENSANIYLYDCTNMRPRPQRVLNYLHLVNAGLADKGNISMPSLKDWQPFVDLSAVKMLTDYNLPSTISVDKPEGRKAIYKYDEDVSDYYNYVERILDDLYRNSWVSVITESSYFEHEHSVFISEKSFKPIAAMQPFITVGSKHTLKYLRKLGYKTFHPFIDESYDDLEDADRFLAIVEALKKIDMIEDKVSWYKNMREILEHNHKLFMQIGHAKSTEHDLITKYYFDYFKDRNV